MHDLPTSVNDRVISPFHEGFTFTKLSISGISSRSTDHLETQMKCHRMLLLRYMQPSEKEIQLYIWKL